MRIGLYGMPTAGKTHILDRIDFLEVVVGSKLLRQYDPDFDKRDDAGREKARKAVADLMMQKQDFIMDGHYAFGDEIAFTENEGKMYDVYLYLYIDPKVLKQRMLCSEKNQKYLKYDIERWQQLELTKLREFCHCNGKDFYVIDNPPTNVFDDVSDIIEFIRAICDGYSCVTFANMCAKKILADSSEETIYLLDGDKTLTNEDSSHSVFGYTTHLYDGNYYTGYQAWKQKREFQLYDIPEFTTMPVTINENVISKINNPAYILTSGHERIWEYISSKVGIAYFGGTQMAAETKFFITKILQQAGRKVVAFGDGMNDYYMLKQADTSYLFTKKDGSISRSLRGMDLEGIHIV